METARMSTDVHERITLYRRFQEIFADQVPALLLYYPVYTYGVDEKVQGVQIPPLNTPADRFTTVADWYIETKRVLQTRGGE